ncbi:hypothetical protein SAY86_020190 [Trapa natans]|uniref:FCP1 homology domain-containing protein n=1 Tax=Trapa natans TaxID=22666 RepID=A0AAN7M2Q2_TRANT|nr:hypothetical protein SAY86_020190 [Trapa natans]
MGINSLACKEDEYTCVTPDSTTNASMNYKISDGGGNPADQTIFYPAFHSSKLTGRNARKGGHLKAELRSNCDTVNFSECLSAQEKKGGDCPPTSLYRFSNSNVEMDEVMPSKTSDASLGDMVFNPDSDALNDCDMDIEVVKLSPGAAAIYFAMKNLELDCVDKYGQKTVAAKVYVQDEESVDFDPFFFMKNLPVLSSVIPTFRTMLLPKRTRSCPITSLVLDLDETLVHTTLEPCNDADFSFPLNFNLQKYTLYVR